MFVSRKVALILLSIIICYIGLMISSLFVAPPVPNLMEVRWRGKHSDKDDPAIRPYKIQASTEDLEKRLNVPLRLTPSLEGVQQQYGINSELVQELTEYWKTEYKWDERQRYLNVYPQFTTLIQGLKLHFVHLKPKKVTGNVEVVPILLLHGWPGSFRELLQVIDELTTQRKDKNFLFEAIVPSLPGYGFSEGADRPGLGVAQVAVVMNNLMKRLGFEKYYVQGGDWGAAIVDHMAMLYPDRVLGLHSNMCFVNNLKANLKLFAGVLFPRLVVEEQYESRLYPFSKVFSNLLLESGYMHLQSTKPDTVGVALSNSPVGLMAYIMEKFTTWTNPAWKERKDGGLTQKFTYDQLLDNIMIYWLSNSITTSMRLYSETFSKDQTDLQFDKLPVKVPASCPIFPHELVYTPPSILEVKYEKLLRAEHMPRGGHFAAFEEPNLLADDIWISVELFRRETNSTV